MGGHAAIFGDGGDHLSIYKNNHHKKHFNATNTTPVLAFNLVRGNIDHIEK